MTDRYENIRAALAMGPTPGPWQAEGGEIWAARPIRFNATTAATPLVARTERHPCTEGGFPWEANAALIAACDPDTIRALLDERDALREALEDIRSRSSMNLAMNPNPFELTAMLGDIHQIADAALSKENRND